MKYKARENHGLRRDPKTGRTSKLYSAWVAMKTRCNGRTKSPAHAAYVRNKIQVCQEWIDSYQIFHDWALANGYKEGLYLDREDTYGNYEPSNCRFVTQRQNQQNTSDGYNWYVNGKVHVSAQEAANDLGVGVGTIRRWCRGRTRKENGKTYTYPAKDGCWAEPKYPIIKE